jgi:uncharacterized membrane protein
VERRDLGRKVAFTDGVMAVAITLLVLNLEVPRVPGDELDEALWDLIPSLIALGGRESRQVQVGRQAA